MSLRFIGRSLARRRPHLRRIGDGELIDADGDEEVLDLPVAERPENLVGDEDGAGRRFGKAVGVERDEPEIALARRAS